MPEHENPALAALYARTAKRDVECSVRAGEALAEELLGKALERALRRVDAPPGPDEPVFREAIAVDAAAKYLRAWLDRAALPPSART